MEQDKSPTRVVYGWAARAGETCADYRERMALIQAETLERRQQELHEQSSPLNTPSDRIRIWERLHQVELPRDPAHRLIALIAANTGLSSDDVHAEQRLRATARISPPPAQDRPA